MKIGTALCPKCQRARPSGKAHDVESCPHCIAIKARREKAASELEPLKEGRLAQCTSCGKATVAPAEDGEITDFACKKCGGKLIDYRSTL